MVLLLNIFYVVLAYSITYRLTFVKEIPLTVLSKKMSKEKAGKNSQKKRERSGQNPQGSLSVCILDIQIFGCFR